MTLLRVPDHVDQGLALLLTQFRNKPRLAGWIKSYLRQVQLLEDEIYDVIIKRMIDRATGEQLDVIGRIVGELREGRDDVLYKRFVFARILINKSTGTAKDVLGVLAATSDSTSLIFTEYFPASMAFECLEAMDFDPVMLLGMLRDAKAAGVLLSLVVPTALVGTRFLFKSVGEPDVANNGMGDANNPSTFGLLSHAVSPRP